MPPEVEATEEAALTADARLGGCDASRRTTSKAGREATSRLPPNDQMSDWRKSGARCFVAIVPSVTYGAFGSSTSASSKRHSEVTRTDIEVGTICLHSPCLMTSMHGGTNASNRRRNVFCSPLRSSGSELSHAETNGRQPNNSGSQYTMPTRETVAGEATARSDASNRMDICEVIRMISPELRHSFLFSSSTVFRDSTHSASTGPSNTTHWRRFTIPTDLPDAFPSAPPAPATAGAPPSKWSLEGRPLGAADPGADAPTEVEQLVSPSSSTPPFPCPSSESPRPSAYEGEGAAAVGSPPPLLVPPAFLSAATALGLLFDLSPSIALRNATARTPSDHS